MNDKDLDAFNEWRNSTSTRLDIHDAWQAACEYKREEYSNLMDAMTRTSQYNHKLQAENKEWREAARSEAEEVNRLQAENKKLRECVEYYADLDDECIGYDIRGVTTAREVLKEVELENDLP
jgi:regulator of replication initiation timing